MSASGKPWRIMRPAGAVLAVIALVVLVARVDAGSGRAKVRTMSASGAASRTESVAGDAVVRAGEMKPGRSVSGTVAVKNSGDATGAFRLSQVDVLDTPGTGGGRLSRMLLMTVEDASTGRRLYRGKLGAMKDQALGYLRAGEQHSYRFTVAHPAGAAVQDGDAYAGSRVETTFDWTAETGAPPPVRDTTPPTVLTRIAGPFDGRSLRVALTCSERCDVAALSGGTWAAPPEPLDPGRPALRTIELSPAQSAALEGLAQRRGVATLNVTVADPAHNRSTATIAIAPGR